ncbi:MAG: hypothetical protein OXH05_09845 [Acidobacteria bacterium]|nr:hypothetical protein [Acidobacteriota bacterium]
MGLRWGRWKLERWGLPAAQTKTGEPPELPVIRQLVALPERRLEANEGRCGAPQ